MRAGPNNVQRSPEESITSVRRDGFMSGHGSRRLGHMAYICEGGSGYVLGVWDTALLPKPSASSLIMTTTQREMCSDFSTSTG